MSYQAKIVPNRLRHGIKVSLVYQDIIQRLFAYTFLGSTFDMQTHYYIKIDCCYETLMCPIKQRNVPKRSGHAIRVSLVSQDIIKRLFAYAF